jgi:hypothetical protein
MHFGADAFGKGRVAGPLDPGGESPAREIAEAD